MKKIKFMFLLLFVITTFISCKNNNVDESSNIDYIGYIDELESQVDALNIVVDGFIEKKEADILNNNKIEADLKNNVEIEKSIELVRTEYLFGEVTISKNAEIKESPFLDSDTITQIDRELSAYLEYVVKNSSGEYWALVRVADTSLGYVRKSQITDVEDSFERYSSTISANGIRQNISIFDAIEILGDDFFIERRDSYSIIFTVEEESDVILNYSLDSKSINGFTIRTPRLPLNSGFKVGDSFERVAVYYNTLYQLAYEDELSSGFIVSDNEYLSISCRENESGEKILAEIIVSFYNPN